MNWHIQAPLIEERLQTHPEEAVQKDIYFRLPIHNALLFKATLSTVRMLLEATPALVQNVDEQSNWLLIHFASFHSSPLQVQMLLCDLNRDSVDVPHPYTSQLPVPDEILIKEKRHSVLRMFSLCHRKEGGEEGYNEEKKKWEKEQGGGGAAQPKKKKQKKNSGGAKNEGKIALFEAPGKKSITEDGMLLCYRLFCLSGCLSDKQVSKSMKISKVAENKISKTILSYVFLEGRVDHGGGDDGNDMEEEGK